MRRRAFILAVAGGSIASLLARGDAVAQTYSTRPITLVVPFPPGGGNDALGRIVADKMSKAIGQQIVVENVQAALSPPGLLLEVPRTVTLFCSATPERSPSIRASMPILATIHARILPRLG